MPKKRIELSFWKNLMVLFFLSIFSAAILFAAQAFAQTHVNMINIRLDGVTEYELAEIFGKVINASAGVVDSRRYSSKIVPDSPQASFVNWRVRIENTDPRRLQSNIMSTIRQIINTNGQIMTGGHSFRFSTPEIDMLRGIRPATITGTDIQFIMSR